MYAKHPGSTTTIVRYLHSNGAAAALLRAMSAVIWRGLFALAALLLLSCSGDQGSGHATDAGQTKFGLCDGVLRFTPQSAGIGASASDQLIVVDINGDGIADLVRAQFDSGSVYWQPGLAEGGFGSPNLLVDAVLGPAALMIWSESDPASVVVAEEFGGRLLRLALDNQTAVVESLAVGLLGPHLLAREDLNADGLPDLVFTTLFDGQLGVLLGEPEGGFGPLQQWPLDLGPLRGLTLADVNADGRVDAVVADSSSVAWLATLDQPQFDFGPLQIIQQGFMDVQTLQLDPASGSIALLDGRPTQLLLLPAEAPGVWGPSTLLAADLDGAQDLQLADLDQNGQLDLLFLERDGGRVGWLPADDQGNWDSAQTLLQVPGRPTTAFWADADNDADLDLVLGFGSSDPGLQLLRQDCLLPPIAVADTTSTDFSSEAVLALNGLQSTDPDGVFADLQFAWSTTAGSISDDGAVEPTLQLPPGPLQLELSLVVSDADGLQSEASILRIEVLAPNAAPIADAGVDQALRPPLSATLDGSDSYDPEGEPLSYVWTRVAGPAISLDGANTASPTLVIPAQMNLPVNLIFALEVQDPSGQSASDSVTITLLAPNQPPIADAGVEQTVPINQSVALDGSRSSDPEGLPLSYNWVQRSGPGVSLLGANTASPRFDSPSLGGILEFELEVTDPDGASSTDRVLVIVEPPNRPPIARAGADQAQFVGLPVNLDGGLSSDPDGDPLSYSWVQRLGPAVGLNNPDSSLVSFVAPQSAGTLEFELTVSDPEGASSIDRVRVEVLPLNQAPVANAGADQTVNTMETVVLQGQASFDPEGSPLTYNWQQTGGMEPAILSDPSVAQPSFISSDSADTLVFALTVADTDGLQSTDTVIITVVDPLPPPGPNNPPVAQAGLDQKRETSSLVTLNAAGSFDPDSDPLTFDWQQIGGANVNLSDPTAASPTFLAPASADQLSFRVVVMDPLGEMSADTVGVEIAEPNNPPIARAGPDQVVPESTTVVLDGSVSNDPDSDPLSFSWQQTGGPVVTLINPNSVNPSFIAPLGPALLSFELAVDDGRGGFSVDTMGVEVEDPAGPAGPPPVGGNNPPNAVTDPDQEVAPGTVVSLVGDNSSDPDGDPLNYLWEQVGGSSVTINNPTSQNASFTAPATEEFMSFRLTVTDPDLASSRNTTGVYVVPTNQAPIAVVGMDQMVFANDDVLLDATSSSDPDGDPLQFIWEQTAGPTVVILDGNTDSPTFTAPNVFADTFLSFRVQISDGQGGVGVATTGVLVQPLN